MILERIQAQAPGLSKSERRVADVFLNEPHAAIHLSIAKMAIQAGVSQPTVNRFCRRVGCLGYPDLKLKLAQELSSSQDYRLRDIHEDLTGVAIFERMFESHLALVQDAHRRVREWPIRTLVDWLFMAQRVFVLAGKNEHAAALRLVEAFRHQGIQASLSLPTPREPLGASDIVLALDLTGTSAANTALEPYRVRGARLVAVAPESLPLAANADMTVALVNAPVVHDADYWITQSLLTLFADSLIMAASARSDRSSIGSATSLYLNRA
ncbi:hypothetical protein GH975_02015 [Litorivicinus lipolyticus]|uniref:HTH rpiR-type domain-containing protein n=1 Tax=Litorivicinus lipolyticus TaxID=418701 RepID=A0A5Q2QEG2_9GAMM|nr:MurR/RpiR family transcriptional regulator [Litorivicinus lipolyticus]QGG79405.1 hypothetical protein GH975_02015 [Litorivicinus lipolyticus]